MISGRNACHCVKRSLAVGARGYVLKDDIQDVIKGIRRVLNGDIYLSKQIKDENELLLRTTESIALITLHFQNRDADSRRKRSFFLESAKISVFLRPKAIL